MSDLSPTTTYDESSPLLHDQHVSRSEPSQGPPASRGVTPLPKAQLAALCSVRLVDPIAFTQIFPYVNEFMSSLHLTDDPSKIGFYSGLVESAFALAQLCSIYQWARVSDVVGRKPVIIIGIAGLAIATLLFGISKSLHEVILSRCLAGLFSGNVAVIHSVLGELTDSTNQALAFPIYGLFWPLGAIIGIMLTRPLVGGTFSNPATKYPKYFDYEFLRIYPYFLPCLVAAGVAVAGVLLCYYFLDETLPSKRRRNRSEKDSSPTYGATNNFTGGIQAAELEPDPEAIAVNVPPPSVKQLLSIPIIRALCLSGFALSFIATAFDVVFVLFCYSSIETGGLGFSASQIGYSLAIAGAISASIQLFFMPTLLRTFDIARLYNFCMSLWPYTFVALPLLNLIAKNGMSVTIIDDVAPVLMPNVTTSMNALGLPGSIGKAAVESASGGRVVVGLDARTTTMIWIGIALVLAVSRIGCLAYSIAMILVKENAPGSALGSANGLTQFAQCFARAIAPAFVSSAFALSVDNSLLGGQLWVLIMVTICILGCSLSTAISKSRTTTTTGTPYPLAE